MSSERRQSLLASGLALGLALVVAGLYAPVLGHDFLEYDDRLYVTEEERVLGGLSPSSVAWALVSTDVGNWHPLPWISHMVDVELYGSWAGGHHASSVALHALAAALLLVVLQRATGSLWRAAFAAALFAVHPLRVESVAWIAERKDVLCGLFAFAMIGAHRRYASRPALGRYLLVVACFVGAAMSKAMAVTLPFVLLLLDYWPLGRVRGGPPPEVAAGRGPAAAPRSLAQLIVEKLPLLAIAAAVSATALVAQDRGGAVASMGSVGLGARLANAVVAYASYLRKTLWPDDLAVFYPHPGNTLAAADVGLAALGLALVSGVALALRRKAPAIGVGWLFFLGALVPVIGLVQVGEQGMADRYTYVPSVGLAIAVAWGLPSRWTRERWARASCAALAVAVLVGLAAVTQRILPAWKNDETLFARALAVAGESRLAHYNFAHAIEGQDRRGEQRFHFARAAQLAPRDALAYYNLGRILAIDGLYEPAREHYRRSIELDAGDPRAWNNLGNVLKELGDREAARRHYERALAIEPDHASAHFNLALALAEARDSEGALRSGRRYLALRPDDEAARLSLGRALANAGDTGTALALLRDPAGAPSAERLALLGGLEWARGNDAPAIEALESAHALQPHALVIANDLAWMLAVAGDAALRDARRALVLVTPHARTDAGSRNPQLLDTLAAAQASSGDFTKAVSTAERATRIAAGTGQVDLARSIEARLARYRSGLPALRSVDGAAAAEAPQATPRVDGGG